MSGVACPICGSRESGVTDTRAQGRGIRRRRSCKSCGGRYSTHEAASYSPMNELINLAGLSRRQRYVLRVLERGFRA